MRCNRVAASHRPNHFCRCILVVLVGLLSANNGVARTIEVGPDKPYKAPSQAAADAKDGDHILIGPGEYFDCTVWQANNLVIEGGGPDAKAIITDKTCQGKAIFVIAGNDTTVRNLTLTRARVPDMNGAGIRMEGRNLTIEAVKLTFCASSIRGSSKHGRAAT